MKELELWFNKPAFRFAAIALIVFACWKGSYTFFWRDEWNFLDDLRNVGFPWFFEPFNGHIKPVFKMVYAAELYTFGTNNALYQYVNLMVFALAIFMAVRLFAREELKVSTVGMLFILVAIIHPVNYNHLLWSFQICQSLFILFQVCSIVYFYRYLQGEKRGDLHLSLLFLVLQNYSFGNGLFFPWIFIGYLVFFRWKTHRSLIALYVGIFLVTIVIQLAFGMSDGQTGGILGRWQEIVLSYVSFMDLNLARAFTVADVLHYRLPGFMLGLFVLLVIYAYRTAANKALLTIAVFWILTNSLSIPMARDIHDAPFLPHYYSVMTLIPTLLIVYVAFGEVLDRWFVLRPRLLGVGFSMMVLAFFVLDNRMNAIFTLRNVRNEAALMKAIREDKTYFAFDDPFFTEDEEYRLPDVKEIYNHWDAKTGVKLNSAENRR